MKLDDLIRFGTTVFCSMLTWVLCLAVLFFVGSKAGKPVIKWPNLILGGLAAQTLFGLFGFALLWSGLLPKSHKLRYPNGQPSTFTTAYVQFGIAALISLIMWFCVIYWIGTQDRKQGKKGSISWAFFFMGGLLSHFALLISGFPLNH